MKNINEDVSWVKRSDCVGKKGSMDQNGWNGNNFHPPLAQLFPAALIFCYDFTEIYFCYTYTLCAHIDYNNTEYKQYILELSEDTWVKSGKGQDLCLNWGYQGKIIGNQK